MNVLAHYFVDRKQCTEANALGEDVMCGQSVLFKYAKRTDVDIYSERSAVHSL